MRKQPSVALVCAGAISRSTLSRLPAFTERLRWVKSRTFSAASRAAHALGRGTAVRDYGGLADADLLLIKVPEHEIESVVVELVASPLSWSGRTVVLLDSRSDSGTLRYLEDLGAMTASVNYIGSVPDQFLVEGHPGAVRALRVILRCNNCKILEIRRGAKEAYNAGVRAATVDFIPLVVTAVERFRKAGMDRAEARVTAATLFENSIRAYFRAGKRLLRDQS